MDGDEEAFSFIYAGTIDTVAKTVHLLLQSNDGIDEVIQEVYLGLWKSLSRYDSSRPFLPWLHGFVVRQVRSARRLRWRMWRVHQRAVEMGRLRRDFAAHSDADEHLTLTTSIEALPLSLREVIVLRYFHGYALTEIAEMLGVPPGTARSRHHRALKQLRIEYETVEGGDAGLCLPREI